MQSLQIHRSCVTRRNALAAALGGAACGLITPFVSGNETPQPPKLNGRIKQAITPGVLRKMSVEQKCQVCVQLGLVGIDFIEPNDWPTLKRHGLICTMAHAGANGLNHKPNHEKQVASLRKAINDTADAGFPCVICLSGKRAGLSDEEGMANCVEALKQVAALAEKRKVIVCMELLNSKRNHKDYQCDHTAWGVAMCKRVGSPRVKLLYDIYHMQVQEGDVIATIRENIEYIAHFHTAGVPGRHEIDETQELYYPAIMQAIVNLKFEGTVAHEYGPTRDPVESLKKAVAICDV
jgi:hydroxypyruvate isomerase